MFIDIRMGKSIYLKVGKEKSIIGNYCIKSGKFFSRKVLNFVFILYISSFNKKFGMGVLVRER